MDKEVDKKIKDMLNANEDIKVPEKISKGVDEVLNKINSNSRNKKIHRISRGIIAATVLIVIIGSLAAFPTLAEEIPIVNRILGSKSLFNNELKENYEHFDNLKNVKDYSIGVDQTVKDKDISITLKEVAYDGAALYIIYTQQVSMNASNNNMYNNEKTVSIGNVKIQGGALIPQKINENTVQITEVYPILEADKIPDRFNVLIDFNKVQDITGSWRFNLAVDKNQLIKNINKKDINKVVKLGLFDKAKILSVTKTLSYATITVEHTHYQPDDYSYSLLDEKGSELQQVDMGGMVKKGNNTQVTRFFKVSNNSKLSKIVILKNKIGYFSPEKIKEKNSLEFNEQLPKEISIGEDKKIMVNKIEETSDKYLITLSAKDISIQNYCYSGGMSVYNREMDNKDHEAYGVLRLDALGNNTYRALIYKKDINFNPGKGVLVFGNYDETLEKLYEINIE